MDQLISYLFKLFYISKTLINVLVDNLKQMGYKTLIQYIVSYGIAIWVSAYKTHNAKVETLLNYLIKYLFNKPKLHFTTVLYKTTLLRLV